MSLAVDGIWIRQCVAFIVELSCCTQSPVHGRGRRLQTRPCLLTLAERTAEARWACHPARGPLLRPSTDARYAAGCRRDPG